MEKILFFGASGKLGLNWVNNLLLNKNHIIANIHKKYLPRKKNLVQKKINLNKPDQLINYCKKNKVNIIINCVGLTKIDKCESNLKLAKYLNSEIPDKLCRISKELKISFVHISTDMLFNGLSKKKYSESHKCDPINIYSKTKLEGENKVKSYSKTLIIRTNFFGFSKKNNMSFSDQILFEQENNKVSYLWKDVFFTPIYMNTLIYFANMLIKKKKFGIYNIVSDEKISKYHLGKKLLEALFTKFKIQPTLFIKKNFVNRPNNMSLSNQKIKKLFLKDQKKFILKNQINEFITDYKFLKNAKSN